MRSSANAQTFVAVSRAARPVIALPVFISCLMIGGSAFADPVGLQWPQPKGPGSQVSITYSYSNLLDGTFFLASPDELRAATEEALRLWGSYAPLQFIEVPDAGPTPSDTPYERGALDPQIRIGHQDMSDLAHGYYPGTDGLSGDVHIATGVPWTVGEGHWNFLEAITHELGHALGLAHELDEPAIMNPSYPFHRFSGLGTAFLFPNDIQAIQSVYGFGHGSVTPLDPTPEPTTIALVSLGMLAFGLARQRRMGARHQP